MIRRVAFRKAILAGVAGSVAWELVLKALIFAGVPLFDVTRTLGTMFYPHTSMAVWWPIGMVVHALIGAIWAIFYAYFFWSELDIAPALQGLAFAAIAALVAGVVMIPQIGWMHPLMLSGRLPRPTAFAANYGWAGPTSVLLGHAIYGLVLGWLYVRPVGYPVGRPPKEFRHA